MNFKDIGIIIAKRPLKEHYNIVSLLTKNNGIYSAVTRSSKKYCIIYQQGNLVDFHWKGRLHNHIGFAKCELIKSYVNHILNNKTKLYAFNSIVHLINAIFQERELCNKFFNIFQEYLEKLIINEFDFVEYIKLELQILAESGYGLEINHCVVTGSTDNLSYVSPKSGKAVCEAVGAWYAEKLIALPKFFNYHVSSITNNDKIQALELTSYFFNRYFFYNIPEPQARINFINHIQISC